MICLGYTNSTANFDMISKLKTLELNVHDFKSNTDTTQKLSLLKDNAIQTDEEGRKYVDILFDEYLPYMKIANRRLFNFCYVCASRRLL